MIADFSSTKAGRPAHNHLCCLRYLRSHVDKALAAAYVTHMVDVCDHYRWRFRMQTQQNRAWRGLKKTDAWRKKYFDVEGFAGREVRCGTA